MSSATSVAYVNVPDAELIDRWQRGETYETIGVAYGINPRVVRRRLDRLRASGMELRRGRPSSPKRTAEVIERWGRGESPATIQREMGLTNGQVMGLVNRACNKGLLARRGPRLPDPERALQTKPRKSRAVRLGFGFSRRVPTNITKPLASVAPRPVLLAPPLQTARTCQWVQSERPVSYCGEPCCQRRNDDGTWHVTSWCQPHYERVYQPSQRQQWQYALGLPA